MNFSDMHLELISCFKNLTRSQYELLSESRHFQTKSSFIFILHTVLKSFTFTPSLQTSVKPRVPYCDLTQVSGCLPIQ